MMDFPELVKFRNKLIQNINHFVFGGWGLDILNGKQTRKHMDVDLVIWRNDKSKFISFLKNENCSINDSGVKIVFSSDKFNGETMLLRKESDLCIFEGAHFRAKLPSNILLPFFTSKINNEKFNIGQKELIVKMAKDFAYHKTDRKIAEQLMKTCNKKMMNKIGLKSKD